MIHDQLLPWLPKVEAFFAEVDPDDVEPSWQKHGLKDLPVTVHAGGVISAPILSPKFCAELVASLAHQKFEPNNEEEPDYRINELICRPEWAVTTYLVATASIAIWPLFHLMYGNRPNSYSSIQFARYGEPGPVGTGWHCDETSEATCTISLDPSAFTGGGTQLRPAGAFGDVLTVPPLPTGHGLLFNGRTTLHRGLPVLSGMRELLVFWTNHIQEGK